MSNSDRLIIVGLTGPAGSGKDAAANILTSLYGFHRIALADAMKGAFDDLSGTTRTLHKDLSDEFSQRKAWQLLGTEARDDTGDRAVWTNVVLAKILYMHRYHPRKVHHFVVPDVSYDFEQGGLGRLAFRTGGMYETWRRDRPDVAPIADQHSSEEGRRTIQADWTIGHCRDMESLAQAIEHGLCALQSRFRVMM